MNKRWLDALECIATHSPDGSIVLFRTANGLHLVVGGVVYGLDSPLHQPIQEALDEFPAMTAEGLLDKTRDSAFDQTSVEEWILTDRARRALSNGDGAG